MKKPTPWWAFILSGIALQQLARAIVQSASSNGNSPLLFYAYVGSSVIGGLLVLFGIARLIVSAFRKKKDIQQ